MTGRRPYFNFESARYSAEWIVLRLDLLGKRLWLSLEDEDDARLATVSTGAIWRYLGGCSGRTTSMEYLASQYL